ncbi:A/G-specific adenine glycosylase [Robbsia andropogonis]|uniref:A/G-specific adenine glycosylase n=1 Tax=Robbsia andropogonis TaxID=28092 RepID=UPI003D22E8B6
MVSLIAKDTFAPRLIAWQRQHGRHDLPWQTDDAYRVWLSEIMLQQTQVATVIPYYARFTARFPDVHALAAAPEDEVMALWAGLGYYSRARNLHRCAKDVVARFDGRFPDNIAELVTLPGIGRSTAAAIAAFAFGAHETILDGNVKRVLARVFGIEGFPGEKRIEIAMWLLAESLLPKPSGSTGSAKSRATMKAYTQGLMDLGATLCVRANPLCERCPFNDDCVARSTGRQKDLPTRKPPKVIPQRETTMLVFDSGTHLLLYRRPPNGIWGGLWSLPEVSDQAQARTLAREYGADWSATSSLAPFTHQFTHFRLTITPLHLPCAEPQGGPLPLLSTASAPKPRAAATSSARKALEVDIDPAASADSAPVEWVAWTALDQYGLPAPVRKLLDGMHGALL